MSAQPGSAPSAKNSLKLVATSDTHFYPTLPIPDGDVFVHCGDALYGGTQKEYDRFLAWIAALPHPIKLYCPGNHDLHVQYYKGPVYGDMRDAGVYVLDGSYNSSSGKWYYKLPNGMRVIGCPWVKNLPAWAFNHTEEGIYGNLEAMGRADIVLAHSPPAGILDRANSNSHYGTSALRKYIEKFEPYYVFCGHVHEGYGYKKHNNTHVYNVSMCDLDYKHTNPPVEVMLPYVYGVH